MKLPRFKIRRLMFVVLACALALGAEATRRRWRDASSAHRAMAEACWRKACEASERATRLAGVLQRDEAPEVARLQRRADYWGALMKEYRRAAEYPWLPVAPAPPEPKDAP
jgi:hypothetical protein